ncbi:hypothetical protein SAMN05421757_102835 [Tropicimonas sediminicola]|uniref:Uncharacterized protein n=1 Tax=Tropicimonas sediminicola TaxID=1031541 RepID=A0A239FW11_9RHOB|nr:hypothetical protein SAMN05421757_102835 [Tropicimonas sediminicola]
MTRRTVSAPVSPDPIRRAAWRALRLPGILPDRRDGWIA